MMKRIDPLCATPASTAICVSTTVGHGGRAIDRHNPHLKDGRRSNRTCTTSPSSHSQSQLQLQPESQTITRSPKKPGKPTRNNKKKKTKTKTKTPSDLIPDSSRYLLSDSAGFLDVLPELDPLPSTSVPRGEHPAAHALRPSPSSTTSTSTSTSTTSNEHQVVILRVSLHCKGCEGKVRKHISKMRGVTSFSIDFAMKKVTVIGDVTPLGVLASISRVKNARFWPSLSSSSSLN